jgi:hypothetical protein
MIYITNKEILDYCSENPQFDLENVLLCLVRAFKSNPNEFSTSLLSDNLIGFKNELIREIRNLPTVIDEKSITDVSNVITPLVSSKLDSFSYSFNKNHTEICSTMQELRGVLTKVATPAKKGLDTEVDLKLLLEKEFPLCEIVHVGSRDQKGKADINILQENFPTIIIDSKNYNSTVPRREVEKFERDLLISGDHGILFSPFSGIYNRRNFQISLINTSISVYISNTGMCISDIRNAIEIIYFMDNLLKTDKSISFSKDTINLVNELLNKQYESTRKIREHLLTSLKICDTVFLDDIKNLLKFTDNKKNECGKCGKVFKTVKPYENHIQKCI